MFKEPKQLLRLMLEECQVVEHAKAKGFSLEQLKNDDLLQRALVKALENIGEAASKVPFDVRDNCKEIKWKEVIGMRQRLVHDYWGVDFDIVWNVIQHKIPDLKIAIEKILSE